MNKERLNTVKEQIQEDILSFLEEVDPYYKYIFVEDRDKLCQIVVDNFKKLDS